MPRINCPFCHLNKTNTILAKSKNFLIIKNIRPIVKGHILLITRNHLRGEMDFSPDMFKEFTKMSVRAREIVYKETGIKAMSFVNAPQDQSVFHYHRHFLAGVFGKLGVEGALRNKLQYI